MFGGSKANVYTLYANTIGVPTVLGDTGIDSMFSLSEWHGNVSPNKTEASVAEFRKKFKNDFLLLRVNIAMDMLAEAMTQAKSAKPLDVARKLEDMRFQSDMGEVWMRKDDHQLQQPLYISTFAKVNGKDIKCDLENTGVGTRTSLLIAAKDAMLPTACNMLRP